MRAADAEMQLQPYRILIMGSAIKTRLLVSQSDEKLLELAQHGCEVAFETLARRYRRPLLRHCRQLCLLEDQAQEVLQRTLAEAWHGLQGQTQPVELSSWLRGIAQRAAAEPGHAHEATLSDGAPRSEDVLALRGALAAISPLPQQSQVFIRGRNGNRPHEPAEDAFDIADSAFHGLLGRARRGVSALTPPPLLAWLAGRAAQGGVGGERIAEMGGGGAAGLGLAVKGGLAALSAGVAITGAVIATSRHLHDSPGGHRSVAAGSPGSGSAAGPGGVMPAGALAGRRASVSSAARHRRGAGAQRSRAHSLRARRDRSVAAAGPTGGSTAGSHVNSSPAGSAAPDSSVAAPQGAGAAQQPSAGSGKATDGEGTAAAGGNGASPPPSPGGSGQPSGSGSSGSGSSGSGGTSKGQGGIGVQISVETGSSGQSSSGTSGSGSASGASSESGGSGSGGSQSGGAGVGISISLGPVGSVGVHVSLP